MIYIILPIAIFVLDGIIKSRIEKTRKTGEKQEICHGRLILTKYYNEGAALNFLAEKPKLMKGIHTVLLAFLAGLFCRVFYTSRQGRKPHSKGTLLALGMILGGGMSNLVDRYRKHHVVDYVSFQVKNKKLRGIVYNISDFFVFAGAILLLIFGSGEE